MQQSDIYILVARDLYYSVFCATQRHYIEIGLMAGI